MRKTGIICMILGAALILSALLLIVYNNLAEQRAERVEKANAVKAIDPAFLLYYERVSTKRWPVVVPLTNDGVCDGCHMKQPPFVEQMVQHNTDLVACTMCGRILYRA